MARVDRHPVVRRGQLLDIQREAHLAGQHRAEVAEQLLADTDRGSARRRRRCCRARRSVSSPAVVADVDPERSVAGLGMRPPARRRSPRWTEGRGRIRSGWAPGPSRTIDGWSIRFATDHVARRAQPGGQHELGVLHGMGGEHVGPSPGAVDGVPGRGGVVVALVLHAADLTADRIDQHPARHRLGDHLELAAGRPGRGTCRRGTWPGSGRSGCRRCCRRSAGRGHGRGPGHRVVGPPRRPAGSHPAASSCAPAG